MLAHRFQRWPDIEKALGECPLFDGICTLYTRCRTTHPILVQCWTIVAAHCWFNTDQSSTTLAQRYFNTGSARHTSTPASTATAVRLTNVASMLTLPNSTATIALLVTFIARLKKDHYPDNMIHWPNCEIMLGHRSLRCWANFIPNKTFQAHNCEYNREYLFFWTLFKDEST